MVISAYAHDRVVPSPVVSRSYISSVRPDAYPKVLRNLIIGALLVNLPVLLLTYAVLPRESIMSGANVLSLVGQRAAGSWLRIIIVIDSAVVVSLIALRLSYCSSLTFDPGPSQLCGGVLVSRLCTGAKYLCLR